MLQENNRSIFVVFGTFALISGLFALIFVAAGATGGNGSGGNLERLVRAYPDFLKGHEGNMLIWKDGTRMAFDDGKSKKDFATLLSHPDLEDQFFAAYPSGRSGIPPDVNQDPGRVRFEPFFQKMYGDCKKGEVTAKLVEIVWLPKNSGTRILVTSVNGVARQLVKVSRELDRLPAGLQKYLTPMGGVYNCRVISGTTRSSVHSFGAAIDINTKFANYWRWTKADGKGRIAYENKIPWEIVEIFEKHGFIWGGKWYHYDSMHFEYRPELIID